MFLEYEIKGLLRRNFKGPTIKKEKEYTKVPLDLYLSFLKSVRIC